MPNSRLASAPAAGLIRRLAALVYDIFPLLAIFVFAGFVVTLILGKGDSVFHSMAGAVRDPALFMGVLDGKQVSLNQFIEPDFNSSHPVYILYLLVMLGVYPVWSMVGRGQTLGQRAWKIKTVNEDGSLLSWSQAIWRCLAGLLAIAPAGLGLLWMLIDPQRRSWHDLFTKSKVVRID